jgi:hypothetical protein
MLLVLALVCLATVGFAADLSIGIGASGSYFSSDLKVTSAGSSQDSTATEMPFNFFAYVETTYLQIAVGYRMFDGVDVEDFSGTTTHDTSSYSYVSLAGYGKFPLQLGFITLIPMIGVEYDITIAATDGSGVSFTSSEKSDVNALWIKAGLGAEIPVSTSFYIRPEFLVGYQLNNQSDQDTISYYKDLGADDASILTLNFELSVLFGAKL